MTVAGVPTKKRRASWDIRALARVRAAALVCGAISRHARGVGGGKFARVERVAIERLPALENVPTALWSPGCVFVHRSTGVIHACGDGSQCGARHRVKGVGVRTVCRFTGRVFSGRVIADDAESNGRIGAVPDEVIVVTRTRSVPRSASGPSVVPHCHLAGGRRATDQLHVAAAESLCVPARVGSTDPDEWAAQSTRYAEEEIRRVREDAAGMVTRASEHALQHIICGPSRVAAIARVRGTVVRLAAQACRSGTPLALIYMTIAASRGARSISSRILSPEDGALVARVVAAEAYLVYRAAALHLEQFRGYTVHVPAFSVAYASARAVGVRRAGIPATTWLAELLPSRDVTNAVMKSVSGRSDKHTWPVRVLCRNEAILREAISGLFEHGMLPAAVQAPLPVPSPHQPPRP